MAGAGKHLESNTVRAEGSTPFASDDCKVNRRHQMEPKCLKMLRAQCMAIGIAIEQSTALSYWKLCSGLSKVAARMIIGRSR